MSNWATFYTERRLLPNLRLAIDSRYLPPSVIQQVEKLITRLPRLWGHEPVPTLLHGDAQQNNFISTELGAVDIDPAVCYGNAEMDLEFLGIWFQTVPEDVFDGYKEEQPIDPGFWKRIDL